MDVEARAALERLLFDSCAPRLFGFGGERPVNPIFVLALTTQVVQFFFQSFSARRVGLALEFRFEILLTPALGCARHGDGRVRLVAECAVAAAAELELYVSVLDLDLRDHDRFAAT